MSGHRESRGRRDEPGLVGAASQRQAQDLPWAMQVAVRYDKVVPPRQVDVAEAVARAVVALLAAPGSAPGGSWHGAVARWRRVQIRKLVRRARGRRWRDVQELPGVTVTQDGPPGWGQAAARAFVPGPVRPLPEPLAGTQVEGTHFPTGVRLPPEPAAITERVHRCPQAAEEVQLGEESTSVGALVAIEVTPMHQMTSGKMAAQCAHAAQLAWESPQMPPALRQAWARDGYRVRVLLPGPQEWAGGLRPVSVLDAGLTELGGPTETARAFW
ncbi:peptidyl-tRNA hydrolase [Actinomyces sp. 2119]|uniref:peptidyl-tRNA hydrolase n=1 Tax=Actinomyces sp. 2119 TaxID=2321393 RepID=UPI0028731580|nr:peptidyl-tRNA hydrolase [Actinomyces sp. 2119]